MADFATAMNVHVPQLELYSWVATDLQTWIDNSKTIYREAEDEVAKVTPSLFREYVLAEEGGRAELLVSTNRLLLLVLRSLMIIIAPFSINSS